MALISAGGRKKIDLAAAEEAQSFATLDAPIGTLTGGMPWVRLTAGWWGGP
jgi:hypothetical protein